MVNSITIFERDIKLEVDVEKLYIEFLESRMPKILKDDKEFVFAINKLIKDSKRHENEFRSMAKKLEQK